MAYTATFNPNFGALGASVAGLFPEKKVIQKKGKQQDTLGIALSGGGYRSAIFNYGVLKGLKRIGVLGQADYLSAVSGGSWIATALATTQHLDDWFFDTPAEKPNFLEEGFESLLTNPARTLQELALARKNANYVSNVYGRLLARTFLREMGQAGRFKQLSDRGVVKDKDRPFLIVNGTVAYRPRDTFSVEQECFEMTRLYCGSRTLGYFGTKDLKASEKVLRVRDAIAVSGAAVAAHLPGLGDETIGVGLSREVVNYTLNNAPTPRTDADHLDVADGGFYNNLGAESLINRGCRYLIVVDAEHDPESKTKKRSNQKYSGLRTLLKRRHIKLPFSGTADQVVKSLDRRDQALHVFDGDATTPSVLYIKLKSSRAFDKLAAKRPYNKPSFFSHLFGSGKFAFNPQFSTAKLDYDFAEHRNLSELGDFIVESNKQAISTFAAQAT